MFEIIVIQFREIGNNGGTAYTDTGFLPSGVSDESGTVLNAGGFYIARYETGSGLISKKGASIWANIDYDSSKAQSKKFINNGHVKSALISGIQWDVVMAFVNGKLDGTGNTFNVLSTPNSRYWIDKTTAGQRSSDKVCNIHDLNGNYNEWVAERFRDNEGGVYNGTGILRGGCSSNTEPTATRTPSTMALIHGSFRMMLYVFPNV